MRREKIEIIRRRSGPPPIANGEDAKKLFISSGDFVRGFVPPDYLVDGILQRRFCYSFTGMTGAGKTTITLHLAACVALGLPFAGHGVEKGRVLFLAGENPDDIRMRWIALSDVMGFDIDAIEVQFIPGVFKISEMHDRIRREVKDLGGVALVVIDTSAAYYEGNDDNSNVEMIAHARMFRKLTELAGGPCVVANCHPVKNASPDNLIPRGGGGFLNEMDGNLTDALNDTLSTVHWVGKFRGPSFTPMTFELQNVTTERIKDSKGRLIPTIIAKPITEEEQQERSAIIENRKDAILLAILALEEKRKAPNGPNIADYLGWHTRFNKPDRQKVNRLVRDLAGNGLVKNERRGVALTAKGRKEVEALSELRNKRDT